MRNIGGKKRAGLGDMDSDYAMRDSITLFALACSLSDIRRFKKGKTD
jgi:hypothetical protein